MRSTGIDPSWREHNVPRTSESHLLAGGNKRNELNKTNANVTVKQRQMPWISIRQHVRNIRQVSAAAEILFITHSGSVFLFWGFFGIRIFYSKNTFPRILALNSANVPDSVQFQVKYFEIWTFWRVNRRKCRSIVSMTVILNVTACLSLCCVV